MDSIGLSGQGEVGIHEKGISNMVEVTETTKLLEKRRLLYEVEEAYAIQDEELKMAMATFKQQEERFKEHDLIVQEKFLKISKQLTENNNKKRRADLHLKEESQVKEEKLKEYKAELETLEQLDRQREVLEKRIQILSKYEGYLERVVKDYPDQFANLGDLLQRFRTLKSANRKLKENEAEYERILERQKAEAIIYEKDQSTKLILLNNQLTDLQKNIENLERQNAKHKNEIDNNEQNIFEMNTAYAKILLVVDNLNEICKKSSLYPRSEQISLTPTGLKPKTSLMKQGSAGLAGGRNEDYFQKFNLVIETMLNMKRALEVAPKKIV